MSIPTKELSKIIHFLEERDLSFVEVETSAWSLRLDRGPGYFAPEQTALLQEAQEEIRDVLVEIVPDETSPENLIRAPMVGIFYSSAVSDVYETLRVGDQVKKGQVLCMVEAMDVEHLVKSDCDGIIVKIIADDGTPVEYGASLMAIRCGD